jgi:hypothetical protein
MEELVASIFRVEKQVASRVARDGKTAVRTLNPSYNKMFRSPYSHGSHGGQHIFIKKFH